MSEQGAQAVEIERLRAHVRTLHQLNGWSKQRGWWCSCRQWNLLRERNEDNNGWSSSPTRDTAVAAHLEHVNSIIHRGEPT